MNKSTLFINSINNVKHNTSILNFISLKKVDDVRFKTVLKDALVNLLSNTGYYILMQYNVILYSSLTYTVS